MKSFHVIQNIPSPYRLHLFTEMHKQLSARGIDFHVHFMSDMTKGHDERPLSWRNPKMTFPYTYWGDYGLKNYHFNPGMIRYLQKFQPDFLLVGCPFDTFTSILAALLLKKCRLCAWTEGNTKTPGKMAGFKGCFKRFVFSQYGYVAVPGIQGKKYIALHQSYTKRRMPECIYLPNLVDETRFKPRNEWPEADISAVRQRLGVSVHGKLCLIPARLEWYKGLLEFLEVLPSATSLTDWRIVIMGQGSLKDKILASIGKHGLDGIVTIVDYVPYLEMPKYYAAADLFLLPSLHDHNPLTVIEALHSGLPVAVSEMAGNVDEGVSEGKNGWILPVKTPSRFSQVVQEIFGSGIDRLRDMGRHSVMENAQFWNSEKAVGNFLSGLGVL